MIHFRKIEHKGHIPLYFQRLPDLINSASLRVTVFVGSADDLEVGGRPGLFPWFEHVPFCGTKKYPGGYEGVDGPFTRYGAFLNAETTETTTSFHITVPKRLWKKGLDVLSELVAFPLLRPRDVECERAVILRELLGVHAEASEYADNFLNSTLFGNHPLAHPILGSEKDLLAMSVKDLRTAHAKGYDRSRMVIYAAGNLDRNELADEVVRAFRKVPDRRLASRKTGHKYGPLPKWTGGENIIRKIPFKSSKVFLLFPYPEWGKDPDFFLRHFMAERMFAAGDLASPLSLLLREKKQLAYDADSIYLPYPDGGYWGFEAECKPADSKKVLRAMWELARDRKVRTSERLRIVKDSVISSLDMRG